MYAYAVESVEAEKEELMSWLDKLGAMIQERDDVLRNLWVVNGILDEGLDSELLRKAADEHRKQDCVPQGYRLKDIL